MSMGVTSVILIASIFVAPLIAFASTSTPIAAVLPVPIQAGPLHDALGFGIDCASSGHCTAVGEYADTIGLPHAMAEDFNTGTWTATPILAPVNAPDYTFSDLNAVSCFSAGNCVAVGAYRISSTQTESFYAVESSGVWARGVELPVPADAGTSPAESSFVSATCRPSGSTCQLLGQYLTDSIPQAVHSVVDTFHSGTGIVGSPLEVSQLSGNSGIELNSISCPTVSDCVAVGAQSAANFESNATYVEETSGVWGSPVYLRNPSGLPVPAEYLSSVSCVARGDCVAAGDWLDRRGNVNVESYTEAAGAWGNAVDIGEPSTLNNPYVDSISCVAVVTSCTIAGALSDSGGSLHAATAQMTGGRWGQLAPATIPTGGIPDHEFYSISCTPGVLCTAVGYYNVNTFAMDTEAMAATWVTGTPPGSVTNLHASSVAPTDVRVSWTAPASVGTGIDHYELMSTSGSSQPVDHGAAFGVSSVVTKLSPGRTYFIGVLAVATDGQTSIPTTIKLTLPAMAPSSPRIVDVTGLPNGLRISWLPPKATGGAPITAYRAKAICGGSIHEGRFPGSARHGMLDGLPAGRTCTVRLSASNRAGSSPPSAPVKGVPLG
jgi:hypothetical protein